MQDQVGLYWVSQVGRVGSVRIKQDQRDRVGSGGVHIVK